jgi:hypothetical protein
MSKSNHFGSNKGRQSRKSVFSSESEEDLEESLEMVKSRSKTNYRDSKKGPAIKNTFEE